MTQNYSTPLATPQLAIGIPLHDCNLTQPPLNSSSALPSPWILGADLASAVKGAALRLDPSPGVGAVEANSIGSGRSVVIELNASMDGDTTDSALTSMTTKYEYVPGLGRGESYYFQPILIHNANLNSAHTVQIYLLQYDGAGAEIDSNLIHTIDDGDNTSGLWKLFVSAATLVTVEADTRWFALKFVFNASSGSVLNRFWGFDWHGLAFSPELQAIDSVLWTIPEDYVRITKDTPQLPVQEVTGSFGDRAPILHSLDGFGAPRAQFAFEFLRANQRARDGLEFFSRIQSGITGHPDEPMNSSDKGYTLANKRWPLIVVPNNPGLKHALYAHKVPVTTTGLTTDGKTQSIEVNPVYSGVETFIEVDW